VYLSIYLSPESPNVCRTCSCVQRLSTSSLPNQCTSSHPQRYPLKLDDFASSKAQKMMRAASWITSNILTSYSGLHVFFSGGSTGRRPFQDLASGAVEGRRRAARRRQELQSIDQGVCIVTTRSLCRLRWSSTSASCVMMMITYNPAERR